MKLYLNQRKRVDISSPMNAAFLTETNFHPQIGVEFLKKSVSGLVGTTFPNIAAAINASAFNAGTVPLGADQFPGITVINQQGVVIPLIVRVASLTFQVKLSTPGADLTSAFLETVQKRLFLREPSAKVVGRPAANPWGTGSFSQPQSIVGEAPVEGGDGVTVLTAKTNNIAQGIQQAWATPFPSLGTPIASVDVSVDAMISPYTSGVFADLASIIGASSALFEVFQSFTLQVELNPPNESDLSTPFYAICSSNFNVTPGPVTSQPMWTAAGGGPNFFIGKGQNFAPSTVLFAKLNALTSGAASTLNTVDTSTQNIQIGAVGENATKFGLTALAASNTDQNWPNIA